MQELSDEALLDLYFSGDAKAFQEFYRRHSGRVVGFAKKKGLSHEAAEEVGQESFLRLHRFIHHYEKGRPALTWFFTIVHHVIVDALRQQNQLSKLRSEIEIAPRDHHEQVQSEDDHNIAGAMAMLSAEQKRVLELKVLSDRSFKEISSSLNKNEVSLRKTFERAKDKMKRILLGRE